MIRLGRRCQSSSGLTTVKTFVLAVLGACRIDPLLIRLESSNGLVCDITLVASSKEPEDCRLFSEAEELPWWLDLSPYSTGLMASWYSISILSCSRFLLTCLSMSRTAAATTSAPPTPPTTPPTMAPTLTFFFLGPLELPGSVPDEEVGIPCWLVVIVLVT